MKTGKIAPPGIALRGWLALTWGLQPLLPMLLKRRLARGKEDKARWREKLGFASASRPDGRLVWLHAVGLGEVLALRGLIARMARLEPDLSFLVTSNTLGSARVLARNMPSRTLHQFAPLDAPGPARRFLDHWRPDLSIWAEQELWPGLVFRADRAGIPLALINARMNDSALARRRRARAIYRDILPRFALISAQEKRTASNLTALGARRVRCDGSLKSIAPPLADDPTEKTLLETDIGDRPLWLAASTHAPDEDLVLTAHERLLTRAPETLQILAPRLPDRGDTIATEIRARGLRLARRSAGDSIAPETQVYLADTLGEMGLFYRLAPVAFIGGSMNETQGHNPWEAATLGTAILHGPYLANFAADYAALQDARAARMVNTPNALAEAVTNPDNAAMAERAEALIAANMDRLDALCQKLLDLV
ncbi:3-deoxy-D-manno-octulosonic acid transferase [Aquicoccus porphyridii]|uniref:3-deoxy-D-manno-octulosonic acid transferase n=1 Tax=Aquicoccus porphyridii TaxID=1852029 RepID=UPI00273D8469|nr:glycosyltransferase N-terminal domain-containing protein [Aquicoccus porphyridii]